MQGGMCKCPHHKMAPFFLVLIGVVFLLKALNYVTAGAADVIWGVLVMCIGFQKMARGMCKCYMNHTCACAK